MSSPLSLDTQAPPGHLSQPSVTHKPSTEVWQVWTFFMLCVNWKKNELLYWISVDLPTTLNLVLLSPAT